MWYNSQKSRKTERIDLIYQVYSNGFTWNGKQPRHICEYSKCISEPMHYTAELFSLSRLQEMHLVMNKQNKYYDMRQSLHTNEVNWYARSWTIYITRFFAIWPNANQIKSLIVPLHKLYCFNSIFFLLSAYKFMIYNSNWQNCIHVWQLSHVWRVSRVWTLYTSFHLCT